MITLLYFARLRELAGSASEQVPVPEPASIDGLVAALAASHSADLLQVLRSDQVRVALNQTLLAVADAGATPVAAGDEVAFLPPVTGG